MPKILVVDDEEGICQAIELYLTNAGFEVFHAYNGKEALKRLYTVSPDLVILDVLMPEMNGYDVCKRIREDRFYKNIPILMLTVKTKKEDELQGYEVGADFYLDKPFDLDVLLARVKVLLKRVSEYNHGKNIDS